MGQRSWVTRVGSAFCPRCGEPAVAEERPRLRERSRLWILRAERIGPTFTCSNRHSWRAPSVAMLTMWHRSGFGRALRLPVQVVGLVRHSRRMTPVPWTYLVAATVGVVLGVVVDLADGPRWWITALAFVATIWLLFMSTAFYGPFRLRRRDYLHVVNPRRAAAEDERGMALAVIGGDLPVYGLDDWTGSRAVGGSGRDQYGPHTIELRYLDEDDGRRWVEVATISKSPAESTSLRKESLAENLIGMIADPPRFDNIEEAFVWHSARRLEYEQRQSELSWEPCRLSVNGNPVAAEMVRVDDGIAVLARLEGSAVEILARNVESREIDLVAVTDLAPYLEGNHTLRGW